MSFPNLLHAALYSRMNAATALTALLSGTTAIYYQQAPPDASLDYVVFSLQAGGNDNDTAHRVKSPLYFIRGYSSTGPAKAGSIDTQIDTLFHQAAISISGWSNFWIAREEDLHNFEIDAANQTTWMAGGFYRIRADKVS